VIGRDLHVTGREDEQVFVAVALADDQRVLRTDELSRVHAIGEEVLRREFDLRKLRHLGLQANDVRARDRAIGLKRRNERGFEDGTHVRKLIPSSEA
jgi:hypothetical protein